MRHQSTDAANRMWTILRSRGLAEFEFRRQYPIARNILDFYCVRAKFAVELDGGQHSQDKAAAYDAADRLPECDWAFVCFRFLGS